ncbi:hypothetical protein GQ42DRAFT_162515 [Ramicandelaber brevisporus]|nr:hypothetical protein GQ42DRAFT_162515 [Ramicandelaber brevisporus]
MGVAFALHPQNTHPTSRSRHSTAQLLPTGLYLAHHLFISQMSLIAQGRIRKDGDKFVGDFFTIGGPRLAFIELPSLGEHPIDEIPATLEYESIGDLYGQFRIGDDSVLGPVELRLSLVRDSVKAKIITRVFPPLPSNLSKEGTVDFKSPF